MNKIYIVITLILFTSTYICIGQSKQELSELLKIDANTFVIKYDKGDFNKDGFQDYIVIDSIFKGSNDFADVRIHIYEGLSNNLFVKKCSSGNLTEEFIFNDNPSIKISEKSVISLFYQSMRHDYELKIAYRKEYKDYIIIGSEHHSYGNGRYSMDISSNYLTKKRIIHESKYNSETDNLDKLPVRTEKITAKAYSLSNLSDDNLYSLFE